MCLAQMVRQQVTSHVHQLQGAAAVLHNLGYEHAAPPHPPTKMGDTHSRHATQGRSLSARGGTAATAAATRRSRAAAAASAASCCLTSVPTRRTCAGEEHSMTICHGAIQFLMPLGSGLSLNAFKCGSSVRNRG